MTAMASNIEHIRLQIARNAYIIRIGLKDTSQILQ